MQVHTSNRWVRPDRWITRNCSANSQKQRQCKGAALLMSVRPSFLGRLKRQHRTNRACTPKHVEVILVQVVVKVLETVPRVAAEHELGQQATLTTLFTPADDFNIN